MTEEYFQFLMERHCRKWAQQQNPLRIDGTTPEKFIELRKQICVSNNRIGEFLIPSINYWTVRDWEDGLQPIPKNIVGQLLKLHTLFAAETLKILERLQHENRVELTIHYYHFESDFKLFDPEGFATFRGNCDLHFAFTLYVQKYLPKLGYKVLKLLLRSEQTKTKDSGTRIPGNMTEYSEAFSEEILAEHYRQSEHHLKVDPKAPKNWNHSSPLSFWRSSNLS